MRTVKFLFPVIFGLTLTFGLVGGLALISGVIAAPNNPTATILYVDTDAIGAATGLSWTDAFTNVQDALTIAISATEIWVAEGVYYPDEGAGQINDAVTSTFVLMDGVAIYGGFAATETLRTERDWETNVTVLSGDIDGNDTTDPHGVVTTTVNITGTNAYHVVYSANVTETAIIDGFSITAGQANGIAYFDDYGGGMHNFRSSPLLSNVIFSGNLAFEGGGGMFNTDSNPTLINVVFIGNHTDFEGGGIKNWFSNPTLINVTFSENSAEGAGGMRNKYNSNPTLTNVTFSDNSAMYGGAMINTDYSSPTLTDVIFSNNSATPGSGGGMRNEFVNLTLTNVIFSGNTADSGAGMYNDSANLTLTNVIFTDNSSINFGGGMYSSSTSITLTNVTFSGNSAEYGGGMNNILFSNPTLTNVTFYGNSANYGGGIYNSLSNPTLTNVILWGNTAVVSGTQIYNDSSSTPNISFSDIQGCGGSASWDPNCGADGGDNIDDDPLFVDSLNDDLHLRPSSPAIDTGTNVGCPATDLDGNPRPCGPNCDMGAYEFVTSVVLVKSVNNPMPIPGEMITFTIQVGNYLTKTITSGLISDTLPAGVNFLGPIILDPPDAGLVGTAPPILASSLVISSGESITVTFPVTISYGLEAGTQLVNVASFSSTEVITPVLSSITLTVQNMAPSANPDLGTGFSTDEDNAFTTASVLTNDTDPNGDTLSVQSFDITGTLGLVTSNGDGTFDYDPNGQFEYLALGEQANDTFTYTVSDGHGGTDAAMLTITIEGINDDPIANDDSGTGFSTDEDSAFTTASVLTNDTDPNGDILTVQSFDITGTLGLVTSNGDGTFDYDPNGQFESLAPGEQANDTFTYTVSDGNGGTDTAVVMITITGVQNESHLYLPLVVR